MIHYGPKQRADGSGWHYCVGQSPIGYCSEHSPHATEAEARECYGRWQRDHVVLDGKCSWTSCRVKGCDAPANRYARIEGRGYDMATLCTEHLDIEHAVVALRIDGPAGDSWES